MAHPLQRCSIRLRSSWPTPRKSTSPLSSTFRSSAPRWFSSTALRGGAAVHQGMAGQQNMKGRQVAPTTARRTGLKNLSEETLRGLELGLLPDTFILPTGDAHPSPFREPRAVARLYRKWFVQRSKDILGHIAWTYTTLGLWALLRLQARRPVPAAVAAARRLHESVYTAYSRGDAPALAAACEDTLLRAYRARLSRRPPAERLEWQRLGFVGRPRLVSFKTAQTGVEYRGEALVVQQAVVRMRSRQVLKQGTLDEGGHGAVGGRGHEGDVVERAMGDVARVDWQQRKEKEVLEYVVVMRRFLEGEPTDWKIWGFVKAPSARDVTSARETKAGSENLTTNGAAAASARAS